jgi:hypothetical protein
MAKVNLMTQAEYAKHRGCSGVAVHKAIKAGRISLIGDKVDPTVADIQWAANTRARQRNVDKAATASGDLVEQAGAAASDQNQAPAPAPAPAAAPSESGYTEARARREKAEAERSEIELKKLRGDLVSWQDVQRGGYEVARELRDTMDSAVSALAAEIASLASAEACAEVIRRHNRAVCEVLVKGWREKIGPLPEGGLA